MDAATDKWPYVLGMTVYEAASVMEALAAKCTAAKNEANDVRYENNSIREKVADLQQKVAALERRVK